MFQQLISIIVIFCFSTVALCQDNVSTWLQRMGCDDLLASYLEGQLEHGSRKEQIRAANQLADVYAVMLARADGASDSETLKRANALFERIPEAGTTALRLQLYRATYIASEQILERYRLRISEKEEADIAITQLHEVVIDLESLRVSLLKRARSSKSRDEKKMQQIGLITSYLAWAKYYIAWYENDVQSARDAAQLFAEILMGERPSLQSVSLDLKSHDTGARSILGIALCKSIMSESEGSEPWLEVLEDPVTWSEVTNIVPLWRFFLLVDYQDWKAIINTLEYSLEIDKTLISRVAAVHALEHYSDITAKEVAKLAIATLVEQRQLGIVRDIISKYGYEALDKNGFIAKYISGDIALQNLKSTYPSEEPAVDETIKQSFLLIANQFELATLADDASQFPSVVDDCNFRLGISLYYAGQFGDAASAFEQAAQGNNKEQPVWMALVCLGYLTDLTEKQEKTKQDLISFYVENWPNSEHAAQLVLYKSVTDEATPADIDDLLSIPRSSPQYEEAQRQASRILYSMWLQNDSTHVTIGNRYISIASILLAEDVKQEIDSKKIQVAIVRALRILEVSLHEDVLRIQAAQNALDALDTLSEKPSVDLSAFDFEISYRRIVLFLLNDDVQQATDLYLKLSEEFMESTWAQHASTRLWNAISSTSLATETEVRPLLLYKVGSLILGQLSESQFGNSQNIGVASRTAHAALTLFETTNDPKYKEDSLAIARALFASKPNVVQILFLNAEAEMKYGDTKTAMQHWKTISSGTPPGSEQWLTARYYAIQMLSADSPTKAIELLEQHVVLYPDYGGGEIGALLEELHASLKGKQGR